MDTHSEGYEEAVPISIRESSPDDTATFSFHLPPELVLGETENVEIHLPVDPNILAQEIEHLDILSEEEELGFESKEISDGDTCIPNKEFSGNATLSDGRLESDKEESDDEEEVLVYIDISGVPDLQELFAVNPDDFLTFQTKRQRDRPQPTKPTFQNVNVKFHDIESEKPFMEIEGRFFSGSWEEPIGTPLFFKRRSSHQGSNGINSSSNLQNLLEEPEPPMDPLFCGKKASYSRKSRSSRPSNYELVAKTSKVLKMTMQDAVKGPLYKLPATPSCVANDSVNVAKGVKRNSLQDMLYSKAEEPAGSSKSTNEDIVQSTQECQS